MQPNGRIAVRHIISAVPPLQGSNSGVGGFPFICRGTQYFTINFERLSVAFGVMFSLLPSLSFRGN